MASEGVRQSVPNSRKDGLLPYAIVRGVSISPDYAKEVTIPLVTILRGVFMEHSFQCPVKPLHHSIALWMVGSGIQLLSSHQCTDVLHQM